MQRVELLSDVVFRSRGGSPFSVMRNQPVFGALERLPVLFCRGNKLLLLPLLRQMLHLKQFPHSFEAQTPPRKSTISLVKGIVMLKSPGFASFLWNISDSLVDVQTWQSFDLENPSDGCCKHTVNHSRWSVQM